MSWIDLWARWAPGGDAGRCVADTVDDLADLYHELAERGELFGFVATERFFEIGTPPRWPRPASSWPASEAQRELAGRPDLRAVRGRTEQLSGRLAQDGLAHSGSVAEAKSIARAGGSGQSRTWVELEAAGVTPVRQCGYVRREPIGAVTRMLSAPEEAGHGHVPIFAHPSGDPRPPARSRRCRGSRRRTSVRVS